MDAPYAERLCLQTARLQAAQNTNAVDQKRHDQGRSFPDGVFPEARDRYPGEFRDAVSQ